MFALYTSSMTGQVQRDRDWTKLTEDSVKTMDEKLLKFAENTSMETLNIWKEDYGDQPVKLVYKDLWPLLKNTWENTDYAENLIFENTVARLL